MSTEPVRGPEAIKFGDYELDVRLRELRLAGRPLKLERIPTDLLLLLAENDGQIVSREQIVERIWGRGVFLDTDNSINGAIRKIRQALHDNPEQPRYVQTVTGRGYRFIAPVSEPSPKPDGLFTPAEPEEIISNADIRAELQELKRDSSSGRELASAGISPTTGQARESSGFWAARKHRWGILAIGTAVILLSAALVWLSVRLGAPTNGPPSISIRRLTASAQDNEAASGAISPDGKYVVYSDLMQDIYLMAIDSGESEQLPWHHVTSVQDWFPDGSHILLSLQGESPGLWKASLVDHSIKKIFNGDLYASAVSPDGSQIAFVKEWVPEVWLMGTNGEQLHRIVALEKTAMESVAWSPTGARLAFYDIANYGHGLIGTIRTSDTKGGDNKVLLSFHVGTGFNGVAFLLWRRDGNIVYSQVVGPREHNLMSVKVGPNSGRKLQDPVLLVTAKWNEDIVPAGFSADGKRLVVQQTKTEQTIQLGSLKESGSEFTPQRLISDNWMNVLYGWSRDGRSVLLDSDRGGNWGIYREDVEQRTLKAIMAGNEDYFKAVQAPDGQHLLFTAAKNIEEKQDPSVRLMVSDMNGTEPQTLLRGYYSYACAMVADVCVLGEQKETQISFFYLSPSRGKLGKIADTNLPADLAMTSWDLSPDGTKIAIAEASNKLRILNLSNRKFEDLRVDQPHWAVQDATWSADSAKLFASVTDEDARHYLAMIQPNGHTRILKQSMGSWFSTPRLSPDGRTLAFSQRDFKGDLALFEFSPQTDGKP